MDTKKLKKYLGTEGIGWIIFGGLLVLLGLAFLVNLIKGEVELKDSWPALLFFGGGAGLIWMGYSFMRDRKKMYQELEESGEIQRVLADFETALPLVNDYVRLGQFYIFGKGKSLIVRYGEIRQVYQHITRRSFVESERYLKYVDNNGKVKDLCNLQLRGKSDEDVMRIMAVIKAKNPNVKLGYK